MQKLAGKKIISGQYCEFIAFALHGEFSLSFKEKIFFKKLRGETNRNSIVLFLLRLS